MRRLVSLLLGAVLLVGCSNSSGVTPLAQVASDYDLIGHTVTICGIPTNTIGENDDGTVWEFFKDRSGSAEVDYSSNALAAVVIIGEPVEVIGTVMAGSGDDYLEATALNIVKSCP